MKSVARTLTLFSLSPIPKKIEAGHIRQTSTFYYIHFCFQANILRWSFFKSLGQLYYAKF
jgi:hypothetical protein